MEELSSIIKNWPTVLPFITAIVPILEPINIEEWLFHKTKIKEFKYIHVREVCIIYIAQMFVALFVQIVLLEIPVRHATFNYQQLFMIFYFILIFPYFLGIFFLIRRKLKNGNIKMNMFCAVISYLIFLIMDLMVFYSQIPIIGIYVICYVLFLVCLAIQLIINVKKVPIVRYQVYTTYTKEIPYKLNSKPVKKGDNWYIKTKDENNQTQMLCIPNSQLTRIEYIPIKPKEEVTQKMNDFEKMCKELNRNRRMCSNNSYVGDKYMCALFAVREYIADGDKWNRLYSLKAQGRSISPNKQMSTLIAIASMGISVCTLCFTMISDSFYKILISIIVILIVMLVFHFFAYTKDIRECKDYIMTAIEKIEGEMKEKQGKND